MTTLLYRNPRLTALAILVILSAGISAFLSVGRQEDPTITNLFATVITAYPGAEPERVEALVTAPIEEQLEEIAEIDTLESTSSAGISSVQVELSSFISDAEIELAWSEIRDALAEVESELPAGAGAPEFDNDRTGAFTAIFALQAREGRSAVPPAVLARVADRLQDRLRQLPATNLVRLYGAPTEEITVTIDPDTAAALSLTAPDLAARIARADPKISAGRVRGDALSYDVTVSGELDTIRRIGAIPVAVSPDGFVTRLSDVATVAKGERLPRTSIAEVDGRPAILIAARMENDRQVDQWMARVRTEIDDAKSTLPGGLVLTTVFDQSTYTADRLAEVGGNMGLGVALVIGV
ncbi:MAG: efflux RND transporter permease subunit, partial [Pseudomonadota bacterium]